MICCDLCRFQSYDPADFLETVNGQILCLSCVNDIQQIG